LQFTAKIGFISDEKTRARKVIFRKTGGKCFEGNRDQRVFDADRSGPFYGIYCTENLITIEACEKASAVKEKIP